MKNKVSAFTIMELVIVLAISTLVIGITYLAFSIVNRQILSYKENTNNINEVLLTDRVLTKDLGRAHMVILNKAGISCLLDSLKIDYQFLDSSILRISTKVDTLHVTSTPPDCFYKGEIKTELGSTIDEINFTVRTKEQELSIHKVKKYDAKSLMEIERKREY